MIEMTKATGVNVYHYLTYFLKKLPNDEELDKFISWNKDAKVEIERRANNTSESYINCQGAPVAEI